ncbi:hypothetical protein GDO78_012183 [Eleutherodactylus coqui]|uniref:Uncharacterized protein n=1 Tax=Eleutherodactylus coqui TaxID=57060 RepID=A0A8J6F2R1_ELECQ|nr:hypothetical protein GDO78_012183 [Eleutherodactylus coqui]
MAEQCAQRLSYSLCALLYRLHGMPNVQRYSCPLEEVNQLTIRVHQHCSLGRWTLMKHVILYRIHTEPDRKEFAKFGELALKRVPSALLQYLS